MLRKELFGQFADFNVVAAQEGKDFDKHRRNVPGLDCLEHFLKTGAFHRRARNELDSVKKEKRLIWGLFNLKPGAADMISY